MSVAWLDFDNDGWLDLLVSSSDYPDNQMLKLYRQNPKTHKFENVTEFAGFNWQNSTQLSLADFDRDGDIDILVGNTHMRLTKEQRAKIPLATAVFRNNVGNKNNFVSLKLIGAGKTGANKAAIGARIVLKASGHTQMHEISGGHGHFGHQDDLRVIFGLAKAQKIDEMTIYWHGKNNRIERFSNLQPNKFYKIIEGKGIFDANTGAAIQKPTPVKPQKRSNKKPKTEEEDFR